MNKVIQTGHSLAVIIPGKFVHMVGIHKGDNVKIERRPDRGQLILHFSGPQQLIINSVLKKVKTKKKNV